MIFPLGLANEWSFNNEIAPLFSVGYYVVERGLIARVPKIKLFEVFYDAWPIISFRSAYRSRTLVDFSMQCYFWQSWILHSQSMSKVTKPWKSDHCLDACEIRVFVSSSGIDQVKFSLGPNLTDWRSCTWEILSLQVFPAIVRSCLYWRPSSFLKSAFPQFQVSEACKVSQLHCCFYFCFQLYVSFFPDSLIQLRKGSCWLLEPVFYLLACASIIWNLRPKVFKLFDIF